MKPNAQCNLPFDCQPLNFFANFEVNHQYIESDKLLHLHTYLTTPGFIYRKKTNAKANFFLWSLSLSSLPMWALNWILYEPVWKRCRFRYNINEPLRSIYIDRKRFLYLSILTLNWFLYEPVWNRCRFRFRVSINEPWRPGVGIFPHCSHLITCLFMSIYRTCRLFEARAGNSRSMWNQSQPSVRSVLCPCLFG